MALVTQSDLEGFFTPRLVRGTFTDDGSSLPGPRLAQALEAGSNLAMADLGVVPAWTTEEAVQAIIDADAGAKLAVCQLVMAIGVEAKPEWGAHSDQNQGARWASAGHAYLKALVAREKRSPAENQPEVGRNTVNLPRSVNARQFEFARRRDQGSSGGY